MTGAEANALSHPYVVFAPYLPLDKEAEIGDWWVGPIDSFGGAWLDPDFEGLARLLMRAFRWRGEQVVEHPALIARIGAGVDGVLPGRSERAALQAAMMFATLDQTPAVGSANAGHLAITSDNTDIHMWPIDTASRMVTLTEGSMIRVLIGGWRIDQGLKIPAPVELNMPIRPVSLDVEIASAVYHVVREPDTTPDPPLARRIGVAISWLGQVWRNTPSLRWVERIILLKTAFEALSGTSKTHETAAFVEARFRLLEADGATDLSCRDLLWSPSERADLLWELDGKTRKVTPIEHWIRWLGEARNAAIHEGRTAVPVYAGRTMYAGDPVFVGERLLRETIRVCLRDLGYGDLWRSRLQRVGGQVLGPVIQRLLDGARRDNA